MLYDRAFGYTIFCDDIRSEVDGKVSFIGSYMGNLLIHSPFPANLAKFAFGINYIEERGVFSEDVRIKIFMPEMDEESGDPFQFTLQRSTIQSSDKGEGGFRRFFSPVIIAPLSLTQAGRIKVRAHCGDVTINLGTLEVSQGQAEPEAQVTVGVETSRRTSNKKPKTKLSKR
jgi:hypothetical protein